MLKMRNLTYPLTAAILLLAAVAAMADDRAPLGDGPLAPRNQPMTEKSNTWSPSTETPSMAPEPTEPPGPAPDRRSSAPARQPIQIEVERSAEASPPQFQMQAQRNLEQMQVSVPNQAPWVNQQQPQHGQFVMGIVGFHVSDSGIVQSIYPGSDVLRYGIHPGDRVLGYNGQKFTTVQNIVDQAVGVPGSILQITFLHNGQVVTLPIRRVDAREFRHFANWGYNHINQATSMDRSW